MAATQESSLSLPTPNSFPAFPFNPPYSIQVELMRHLYSAIEHRQVSIAESPTGTGKTLSLLSATITWLDDDKYRARKGELDALSGDDGWCHDQTNDMFLYLRKLSSGRTEADEKEYEERLAAARKREEKLSSPEETGSDEDDSFLPDDDGTMEKETRLCNSAAHNDNQPSCAKIFYASRTHSQLSQVVPELRKLRRETHRSVSLSSDNHPSIGGPAGDEGGKRKYELTGSHADTLDESPETRFVSLGSRKQLCLNEGLKAKGGDLDERCRDLLQGTFNYPLILFRVTSLTVQLEVISDVHIYQSQTPSKTNVCTTFVTKYWHLRKTSKIDRRWKGISDLSVLCLAGSYFASRSCHLALQLLLHRDAREALNIDLTNQVVVIDEAHNLISSLLALSTVTLPLGTLNRLYRLLHTLKALLSDWQQQNLNAVMTVDDLLSKLGGKLEEINFLEIQNYLRKSKAWRNTSFKARAKSEKNGTLDYSEMGTPPLYAVQEFIAALAAATDDGRIIFTHNSSRERNTPEIQIKYQSLNPAPQFRAVVDAARSVILAGGTMSPMSDFTSQLFPHLPSSRIALFSCDHITSESNLRTLIVPRGPQGSELNFKFSNMENGDQLLELGQIVANFARIVPGGMVVFLPSYRTLEKVKNLWDEKGIMGSIRNKKKARSAALTGLEAVFLPSYRCSWSQQPTSTSYWRTKGALLLAVVGAKLSEGLNFSDDLARMVMVIGLPFANLGSAELQERLKHADRLAGQVVPKGSNSITVQQGKSYTRTCA
ncbi:helicase C-terminal domain-containing protein [Russula vinacea]|nr:helicase C-terminal domain-containing protein [Russula vinacea]